MLSATLENLEDIKYPVAVTEKIDGIRALIVNGKLMSRTMKPIPNKYICEYLESVLPEHADGEIVAGNLQETSSTVMSRDKIGDFTFYWFDLISDEPYMKRMEQINKYPPHKNIVKLLPQIITNEKDLLEFEQKVIFKRGEGIMIRSLNSPYKHGRSTVREGYLMKLKRFRDAEATIEKCEELIRIDGTPGNMLGSFVVHGFRIGTGFTEEQRKEFWKHRKELIGKKVKYKYFEVGMKNAPRHPVFLDLRSDLDI